MADKNWLRPTFGRKAGADGGTRRRVLVLTAWGSALLVVLGVVAIVTEAVMDGEQLAPGLWVVLVLTVVTALTALVVGRVRARRGAAARATSPPARPDEPHEPLWMLGRTGSSNQHRPGAIEGFRVADGRPQVLVVEPSGITRWVDLDLPEFAD